jgi:hypothetical protein
MDVDPRAGTSGNFDKQVAELEVTLAKVNVQSTEMEKQLRQQMDMIAGLDTKFEAAMLLLQRHDIRPQIDRVQTAILKDIEANERLCVEMAKFRQQSAARDNLATELELHN